MRKMTRSILVWFRLVLFGCGDVIMVRALVRRVNMGPGAMVGVGHRHCLK